MGTICLFFLKSNKIQKILGYIIFRFPKVYLYKGFIAQIIIATNLKFPKYA